MSRRPWKCQLQGMGGGGRRDQQNPELWPPVPPNGQVWAGGCLGCGRTSGQKQPRGKLSLEASLSPLSREN